MQNGPALIESIASPGRPYDHCVQVPRTGEKGGEREPAQMDWREIGEGEGGPPGAEAGPLDSSLAHL